MLNQSNAEPRAGASKPDKSGERRLTIGELAEEFGCTHRTIRFYEDQGLLSPRREGQARIFSGRDRARLSLILRGRRLGFSLAEIGEMLDLYDSDPGHVRQLTVALEKGRARIAQLERQRVDIDAALAELRELEAIVVDKLRQRGVAAKI
ncbi:MAG TPA: MerR family DNA-binding transcriptional regulator [Alphaproteobacteria bacterium]|nr:MerR family DNA-binding transcriptional regulator [Alphaproteobacteria bacterium]